MTDKPHDDRQMADNWQGKPPGSEAAVQAGCTCSVIDNHYGRGFGTPPRWYVSGDCPLHGMPVERGTKHDP